jgi:hypothetical protein
LKNLEFLLFAMPSVVMLGFTMYMKNLHEGESDQRAAIRGWTYGILGAAFFVFVLIVKFVAEGHSV